MLHLVSQIYRAQRQLSPDKDLLKDLDSTPAGPDTEHIAMGITPANPSHIMTQIMHNLETPGVPSDDPHDNPFVRIPTNLARSKVNFFGKSSEALWIRTALSIKREHSGPQDGTRRILDDRRPEFWTTLPVRYP